MHLVVLSNGGKVSAFGPGSRFGMVHEVFGVKPADENVEVAQHGQNVSFEYIVDLDPDYLFVIDRVLLSMTNQWLKKQSKTN